MIASPLLGEGDLCLRNRGPGLVLGGRRTRRCSPHRARLGRRGGEVPAIAGGGAGLSGAALRLKEGKLQDAE